MAGGWSIGSKWSSPKNYGSLNSTSAGTLVTTNSTANTLGSYKQITSSAGIATPSSWMIVTIDGGALSSNTIVALTIAIGSTPAITILSNLVADLQANQSVKYEFPMYLPAGTQIWVAAQGNAGVAESVAVSLLLWGSGYADAPGGFACCYDTYGFVSTSSQGTLLTSGAANTEGAFVNFGQVTNNALGYFMALDTQGQVASTATKILMQMGGVNTLVQNFALTWIPTGAGKSLLTPANSGFYPMRMGNIGTRIGGRIQSNLASVGIGLTLYLLRGM